MFQQEERLFQMWYPESFMRIMGANSIITMLGSSHKHLRNLVLRLFGPENLPARHDPGVIAIYALQMIFSVTAKKLIGYDSSTSNEEMWKQYNAFFHGLVALPLYIPGTAFYKCMQGRKNVMKTLKELFDERKNAARRLENIDFIDVLIEELEKDTMSENAALELVFLLLFASFETTSSAIAAVIKFLTDNPKALQELTEEHDYIQKTRANPNSGITWEEYKSMKFTSHVIHEGLRLANVATVVFRKAIEDVHIKDYAIPNGSKIMICASTVHQNTVAYKDPNIFNPWRWKDIAEPVGGASKDFMAFGGGMRLCAGADFAKLQMAIFLHCLVTKYRDSLVLRDVQVRRTARAGAVVRSSPADDVKEMEGRGLEIPDVQISNINSKELQPPELCQLVALRTFLKLKSEGEKRRV
ncbi:hypothetical protein ABZP36_020335 [Zizania latifolia]